MEPLEDLAPTPVPAPPRLMPKWVSFLLFVGFVAVLASAGFNLVYAGKIYPGVSVNGTYVGGLDREHALAAVNERIDEYRRELIPITHESRAVRISPDTLDLTYNPEQSVGAALGYGRDGSWIARLKQQVKSLLGQPTNYATLTYNDDKLASYIDEVEDNVGKPVSNASFNISGSSVTVNQGQEGRHVNLGGLVMQIKDRLSQTITDPIAAPISVIKPTIDTASIEAVKAQASTYVSAPISLTYSGKTYTVDQDTIVSWFYLSRPATRRFETTHNVADFVPTDMPVTLTIDKAKVDAYIESLATKIDQAGQNAALSIQDGRAVVFRPSRPGLALDRAKTASAIEEALVKSAAERTVALTVAVKQPDVTEGNLNDLGIKELLGEGISFFPGSNAARINNIRLGTALYNGILVKPGETFSFNQYFINVDAEHGWVPGLSIIGNKIEPIFGGGICQVSSTLYRAALLAGLPIKERTNHAYAVSYYTAPFGTPGVDATVYNPGVDFKFENDTSAYILIQPILTGTTLKFQLYGTKTKSGAIRGPFFIDGSIDHTKPSTTIFYRDILDASGKVIKTDSVTTRYKSSLDFKQVDTP